MEMPWIGKCKAMVHGYLCGQAGASAVLEVILGQVNPSGKLSETYPLSYEDIPSSPYFPAKQRTVEYREGLYVGYRYFETAGVDVLFPGISVSLFGVDFKLAIIGNALQEGADGAYLVSSELAFSQRGPAQHRQFHRHHGCHRRRVNGHHFRGG